MRNIAKCRKCLSVIESLSGGDHVSCKCGEIFVSDGDGMRCGANDWSNFVRVDDEGNEIVVKVEGKQSITDKDLLDMLDKMVDDVERLPLHAMTSPITHYDYHALMVLLSAMFKRLYK